MLGPAADAAEPPPPAPRPRPGSCCAATGAAAARLPHLHLASVPLRTQEARSCTRMASSTVKNLRARAARPRARQRGVGSTGLSCGCTCGGRARALPERRAGGGASPGRLLPHARPAPTCPRTHGRSRRARAHANASPTCHSLRLRRARGGRRTGRGGTGDAHVKEYQPRSCLELSGLSGIETARQKILGPGGPRPPDQSRSTPPQHGRQRSRTRAQTARLEGRSGSRSERLVGGRPDARPCGGGREGSGCCVL